MLHPFDEDDFHVWIRRADDGTQSSIDYCSTIVGLVRIKEI